MSERIGIAIITCNRREMLVKLLDSIKYRNDCELIVINDGEPIQVDGYNYYIHQNETNLGVAKSKNKGLKHLLDLGCDHIFLIEDDMYIKDDTVFEKYIEASKVTGIQHFNFSQHGIMNKKWPEGTPNPINIIDYVSIKIELHRHCVGAFSYYSRKCLETVGLMDERYYNACEHVDHTYEIIKAGMHPSFWYFTDIENSSEYLGDEEWSLKQSTISSNPNHIEIVSKADEIFKSKHGHLPVSTPMVGTTELVESLKKIKARYGRK